MRNQERQKVGMVIGLISSVIGLILFFLLEIIKLIKVPSIIVEGFLVIGMFILSLSMIVFKDKSENKNDSPVIAEDTKHKLIVNEVTFIGQGHYFQIWEPKAVLIHQKKSRARLISKKKTLGSIIVNESNEK